MTSTFPPDSYAYLTGSNTKSKGKLAKGQTHTMEGPQQMLMAFGVFFCDRLIIAEGKSWDLALMASRIWTERWSRVFFQFTEPGCAGKPKQMFVPCLIRFSFCFFRLGIGVWMCRWRWGVDIILEHSLHHHWFSW